MEKKQRIAVEIALQTQVLKTCPLHSQLYLDDDASLDRAFALAVELVRRRKTYVQEFGTDSHELTGLLSSILGGAPECCPDCEAPPERGIPTIGGSAAPLSSRVRRGGLLEAVR